MRYETATSAVLGMLSRTVNSAVAPSLTAAASSIDSSGASSSSVIVPTPVPSATVAPVGALSSTVNVSSDSASSSCSVCTTICRETSPTPNVRLPCASV